MVLADKCIIGDMRDNNNNTAKGETMTDMTNIFNVELTMTDDLSGETVVRTIDKGNAMTSGAVCWELRDEASQRKALEEWIQDRGNKQHETLLSLVSWKFC